MSTLQRVLEVITEDVLQRVIYQLLAVELEQQFSLTATSALIQKLVSTDLLCSMTDVSLLEKLFLKRQLRHTLAQEI